MNTFDKLIAAYIVGLFLLKGLAHFVGLWTGLKVSSYMKGRTACFAAVLMDAVSIWAVLHWMGLF